MEAFLNALNGSFVQLLIFQVSVVGVLMLALVYLLMRRALESGESEMVVVSTNVESVSEAGVLGGEATSTNTVAGGEEAVDSENETPEENEKGDKTKNKSLRDKIRYLESKLLEYEILQEEIGTLSGLKMENEHLKRKIKEFEQKTSEPGSKPVEKAKETKIEKEEETQEEKQKQEEELKAAPVSHDPKTKKMEELEGNAEEILVDLKKQEQLQQKVTVEQTEEKSPPKLKVVAPQKVEEPPQTEQKENVEVRAQQQEEKKTTPEISEPVESKDNVAATSTDTDEVNATLSTEQQDLEAVAEHEPSFEGMGTSPVSELGEVKEVLAEPPTKAEDAPPEPDPLEGLLDQIENLSKEELEDSPDDPNRKVS